LGAQRKPIEKNDIPNVLSTLTEWHKSIQDNVINNFLVNHPDNTIVDNKDIATNGDFNLSIDRYKPTSKSILHSWDVVTLGDERYFKIESGGTPDSSNEKYWGGDINWATLVDLPSEDFVSIIKNTARTITQEGLKNSSATLIQPNAVIVSTRATIGRVGINKIPLATNQGFKNIIITNKDAVVPQFLAYMVKQIVPKMIELASGGTFKEISKSSFSTLPVPLPPKVVQLQIVAEIECYQRIIDGARQVVDNWKPNMELELEEERKAAGVKAWEMVKLGDMCETSSGGTPLRGKTEYYDGGTIPWVKSGEVAQGYITETDEYITEIGLSNSSAKIFPINTVLVAMYGATAGKVGILKTNASTNQAICGILPNDIYIPEFLFWFMREKTDYLVSQSIGGAQPNISQSIIKSLIIPSLPKSLQKTIVSRIEAEFEVVEANRKLIHVYEGRIKKVIERVLGI
jgi:type I restriction enzyme M protein